MAEAERNGRYARVQGLIGAAGLPVRRTNVVGVGRIGAWTAEGLVRLSLGTRPPGIIRLFDPDTVEWPNLTGTPYREAHAVERTPKVEALAGILQEIDSDVSVATSQKPVEASDAAEFAQLGRQTELQLLTLDDQGAMFAIADACHDLCPQVAALAGPRAEYAEVAFSVPGQTPRLTQTLGRRRRDPIAGAQALGCDVTFITSFVTAVCVRLLMGGKPDSVLPPCYADAPLFVLGLRRGPFIFKDMPLDQVRSIVLVSGPR